MKPTNYHLFDFLDFDPDLSRDESLCIIRKSKCSRVSKRKVHFTKRSV